jgi:hypothetical protein
VALPSPQETADKKASQRTSSRNPYSFRLVLAAVDGVGTDAGGVLGVAFGARGRAGRAAAG